MDMLLAVARLLVLALLVALAIACVLLWRRDRSKAAAWSAVSFGLLGGTVALSRLASAVSGGHPDEWISKIVICGLVLFPYALYRFMTAFWPSGRLLERIAFVFTGVLIVWTLALPTIPEADEPRSNAFLVFVVAFLVHWSMFSAIAAYRLWRAGGGRPTVARRRMRLLSAGALGMTLALILAGFRLGGTVGQLVTQALGFAAAILFYAGIAPPTFLRATWRRPEQEELRAAVVGLMRARTVEEIGAELLPHVARLVGAPGAELRRADGTTIQAWGARAAGDPVRLEFPFGELVVWADSLTPFYGPDEIDLLRSLGALIELAFERAELLDRERQTVARLQEVDEMKNTFLSAVSHELRTPLAVILGTALTLEQRGADLSEHGSRELLQALADAAWKLERLLVDLLDLDRLTRGVVELRREQADVGEIVRRVAEAVRVGDRVAEVDVDAVSAFVDPGKVERIVENLVANALKHTPAGTPVRVELDRQPDGVCLRVDDAGPGVPRDLREEIFEPFQRVPGADYAPGTGIGLSLVARFAALHGGRAWVEERPGGGSSFRVFLPYGEGARVGEPVGAASA